MLLYQMAEFSEEQESAIEEKIRLFSPIQEKGISRKEYWRRVKDIETKITDKRLDWYYKNQHRLDFLRDSGINDIAKALALMYEYYMGVSFNEVCPLLNIPPVGVCFSFREE